MYVSSYLKYKTLLTSKRTEQLKIVTGLCIVYINYLLMKTIRYIHFLDSVSLPERGWGLLLKEEISP